MGRVGELEGQRVPSFGVLALPPVPHSRTTWSAVRSCRCRLRATPACPSPITTMSCCSTIPRPAHRVRSAHDRARVACCHRDLRLRRHRHSGRHRHAGNRQPARGGHRTPTGQQSLWPHHPGVQLLHHPEQPALRHRLRPVGRPPGSGRPDLARRASSGPVRDHRHRHRLLDGVGAGAPAERAPARRWSTPSCTSSCRS